MRKDREENLLKAAQMLLVVAKKPLREQIRFVCAYSGVPRRVIIEALLWYVRKLDAFERPEYDRYLKGGEG